MKLHVVFDQKGTILAAARVDREKALRVRPMADEKTGHRAAELDVPVKYREMDLPSVCRQLQVDVAARIPELKAKE